MSCKTPTSNARSLSPSDESRFVPHSSVLKLSSVMERHFMAASEQAEKEDGEKFCSEEKRCATVGEAQDSKKEQTEVTDDEKGSIVGATICFTPEPSPPSSPNRERSEDVEANIDSLDSHGNSYVGDASGESDLEGLARKTEGSATYVASSLDGKSTTEYDMVLDNVSSKGTIEVEDLASVGGQDESTSEKKEEAKSERQLDEADDMASTLSPCSTLPSLSDTPFKMFKTPQLYTRKSPYFTDEDRHLASTSAEAQSLRSGGNEEGIRLLPNLTVNTALKAFKTPQLQEKKIPQALDESEQANIKQPDDIDPCFGIALKLDLEIEDTLTEKDSNDSNSRSSLCKDPKDSDCASTSSLAPFKNLHKCWEDQSSFTHMTKNAIGRVLGAETQIGAGLDADKKTKANVPRKSVGNDVIKSLTEFKSPTKNQPRREIPLSCEKSAQTSDIYAATIESLDDQHGSAEQVISESSATFVKVIDALSAIAGFGVSLIVSVGMTIGVFLRKQISSALTMKNIVGQIMLQKVLGGTRLQTDKTAKNDINKGAASSEDATEYSGTNLSKLFLDEARQSESGDKYLKQMHGEAPKKGSHDCKFAALDSAGKSLLKTIDGNVIGGIIAKLKGIKVRNILCALISIILMWSCVFQRVTEVAQVISNHISDERRVYQRPKEDASFMSIPLFLGLNSFESFEEEPVTEDSTKEEILCCLSTKSTTFESLSLSEFNLSPTLFDSSEEEVPEVQASLGFWLSTFGICSVMFSLFCALVFKSKIHLPFIKPKSLPTILTGVWAPEEHQQFIEGHNVHGNCWKLVSVFVPTRTDAQVANHGRYWLEIGSPPKMKKTRKVALTPASTPHQSKSKRPTTTRSVASPGTTPRQSNKARVTPARGILIKKDCNKADRNVTPRSSARIMRMRAAEGSKSDPGKRRAMFQDH